MFEISVVLLLALDAQEFHWSEVKTLGKTYVILILSLLEVLNLDLYVFFDQEVISPLGLHIIKTKNMIARERMYFYL